MDVNNVLWENCEIFVWCKKRENAVLMVKHGGGSTMLRFCFSSAQTAALGKIEGNHGLL